MWVLSLLCWVVLLAAAAAEAAALGLGGLWLDENGLMVYEPSPAKVRASAAATAVHCPDGALTALRRCRKCDKPLGIDVPAAALSNLIVYDE
jgi:hypothetical protein